MFRTFSPWSLLLVLAGTGAYTHAQVVEGLVNIRFLPDVRIFAAMAAINAAGFDLDGEKPDGNPARRLVRERVAGLDPDLRERLTHFYATHNSEGSHFDQQIKYVSYALLLAGPPEFTLTIRPGEVPAEAAGLLGFEALLQEFWSKGGLERLWAEVRPAYAAEAVSYRPLIRDMILATLRYLRVDPRVSLDRRVTFMPDLMNAFGIVNARNVGDDYFVVVGPSRKDTKLIGPVRHEYLHFLLDPLVAKYRGRLPEAEPFLKRLSQMPDASAPFRNDFQLMTAESLIRSLESRLRAADRGARTAETLENYGEGLILTPYFDEALERFERDSASILNALPGMLEGIRWDAESRRSEAVDKMRREAASYQAAAQKADATPASSVSKSRPLLEQANASLLAGEFDKADPLLQEVLQLEPENASALFGLAQIAAHRAEPARALELYEQAAANARDKTWIAGWSFVHRGTIYRLLGEIAKAREEWSKALQLQGNLHGAAEAASKALAENPPPAQYVVFGPRDGSAFSFPCSLSPLGASKQLLNT